MRRDPVTATLHRLVLERDQRCFLHIMDAEHICRDTWGTPHSPYDRSRLTVDHVKRHARMGLRASSDMAHLIAMCAGANVGVPSKEVRAAERSYLASLYPGEWR